MSDTLTVQRKADHLSLCAEAPVGSRAETLLSEVFLIHDALPELSWDELDTSSVFMGKRLSFPLFIASMSGGTDEALAFNHALAAAAERHGIGFALGSQRVMLRAGRLLPSFDLRAVAPTALLLGNLGVNQLACLNPDAVLEHLVKPCGLDGMCIHLNPAMELIQSEGDRDFRGGLQAIAGLVRSLPVPVLVKETGCGLSRAVAERLSSIGVRYIDVSGAGGTSFVGVETLRARAAGGPRADLGEVFWDWGIPTAASLCQVSGLPLEVVATGGIGNGLDMARSLVLGAQAVGVARPFVKAWRKAGSEGVDALITALREGLKMAMLLTGSRNLEALRQQRFMVGAHLAPFLVSSSPVAERAWQRSL